LSFLSFLSLSFSGVGFVAAFELGGLAVVPGDVVGEPGAGCGAGRAVFAGEPVP
jgi:hypothetical protein